jgi:protein-disulfide isomerase
VAPAGSAGLYALSSGAALLGIPVVIFSLYQQYWVAKAWCRLCLLVDAVLLLQAGLALYAGSRGEVLPATLTPLLVLNSGLALVASGGLVVLLKQLGRRQNELQESETALQRSKNSVALFTNTLLRQPRIDTGEFGQELVIGSDEAPLEIIMASSLYCAPCKKGHEQLARLVALHPDKLRVRFRLVLSAVDTGRFPTANQYVLQHWLTHSWGQPDERARTAQLLHEWYEEMNLDHFARTHPADFSGDYALSTELSTQHYRWVNQSRITRTPTYFLNGYLLPGAYRLPDLTLLLPALAEYFSQDVATA